MSNVGCCAIECVCVTSPIVTLQYTALSGYAPFVRLRNLKVITFFAGGTLLASQKPAGKPAVAAAFGELDGDAAADAETPGDGAFDGVAVAVAATDAVAVGATGGGDPDEPPLQAASPKATHAATAATNVRVRSVILVSSAAGRGHWSRAARVTETAMQSRMAARMTKRSRFGYSETIATLTAAMTEVGNTIFALIDQSAAAESAGLVLRPTTLIIFGNPKGGTPLMEAFPLIALALPLKVLVWDEDGVVDVAYETMAEVAARYDITGVNERITAIDHAVDEIIGAVA